MTSPPIRDAASAVDVDAGARRVQALRDDETGRIDRDAARGSRRAARVDAAAERDARRVDDECAADAVGPRLALQVMAGEMATPPDALIVSEWPLTQSAFGDKHVCMGVRAR